MRSKISRAAATLALLTCVVCPVLETFDHWDHTLQTGQDTEYILVLLALCIGVAYAFARFVLKFPLVKSAVELVSNLCAHGRPASGERGSLLVIPIPLSPPRLALRI